MRNKIDFLPSKDLLKSSIGPIGEIFAGFIILF